MREVLVLDQPNGVEMKSCAYDAQALLLLVIVPLYGALAARLSRLRLINGDIPVHPRKESQPLPKIELLRTSYS